MGKNQKKKKRDFDKPAAKGGAAVTAAAASAPPAKKKTGKSQDQSLASLSYPLYDGSGNFFYRNRFLFLVFILSAILVLITYAVKGVYPFGNGTLLRVDLYHQYAPFLEELHSRILSGKSLLYSWEGGLGKDFVAQMAYYTTSPLNLLMFFFKEKNLPEMVALFILLKICFASVAFSWFLRFRYRRNDVTLAVFGLLYGFCGFMTCYYWNIMWLDTVVLFPLVCAGVYSVLHGKCGLYYVSLTLTMVVNFYLAVLVCVFVALYFLVGLLTERDKLDAFEAGISGKGTVAGTGIEGTGKAKQQNLVLRRMLAFAAFSILAAVSSLFILWPVAKALAATAVSDTTFPRFEFYKSGVQLLTNHFLGARPAVLARNEDLPNIYTGVLTMVLLPFYFGNRGIKRSQKIGYGSILVFYLLCSCMKQLDFMIHGFHFPANLPHRYTFMYSFLLLTLAYEAFLHLSEASLRWPLIACGVYLVSMLVTENLVVPQIYELDRTLTDEAIILNVCLLAVYLVLFFFLLKEAKKGKTKAVLVLTWLLLPLALFEASYTSIHNLEDTGSREAYVKYMDDADDIVAMMDENAQEPFYRAEFRRFTTINDASLYHYNGFSQFSSLEPGGLSSFMGNLGIAATGNSFRYYDATPLVDAMFDLKYTMNKDGAHPKASKYEYLGQHGTIWLYENPRYLPLAFLVNPALKDWQTKDSDPFTVQNDFLKLSAGIEEDMFEILPIDADHLKTENITTTPKSGINNFSYTVDDPENLYAEPTVSATYVIPEDMYVYLFVDAGNAQRFLYHNNTVNEDRELSAGKSMIDVGEMKAGETLYVSFKLTRRGAFEKAYRSSGSVALYAAAYKDDIFQKGYDILKENGCRIDSFSDTHIEGSVSAEEDSLLFTSIPWYEGWEVSLDGERIEKVSLGENGLIAIDLPAGEHTVVFDYHMRFLPYAAVLSLVGILAAAVLLKKKVLGGW